MRRTAFLLLILIAALPALARRRAVRTPRQYPPCAMITGTAGVTFTHDFGATLAFSRTDPSLMYLGIEAID